MKKTLLLSVLMLLMTGTILSAKSHSSGSATGTGIGIVVGYPGNVGLSIKIQNFPVLGLSWYLGQSSYFGGTIDWWFINNSLESNFYWYLGFGGYVWLGHSVGLGPRLPIGLQWFPGGSPFEIALEVAPALSLLPGIDFVFQGSLAFRYHF
jgi:hypothetical protein